MTWVALNFSTQSRLVLNSQIYFSKYGLKVNTMVPGTENVILWDSSYPYRCTYLSVYLIYLHMSIIYLPKFYLSCIIPLSIYLSIYTTIYLSAYYLFIYLSTMYMPIYLLSLYPSSIYYLSFLYLSTYLSIIDHSTI